MKKKIIFPIIVFLIFFCLAGIHKTNAIIQKSTIGWLWGGNEDCDMDRNGFKDVLCGGDNKTTAIDGIGDGTVNGNESGVGWISMNSADIGSVIPYGVNIPDAGGPLSGYAWSQNLGWIDFSGVSRSGNSLIGQAMITSIAQAGSNAGGWLGGINMSGVSVAGNALSGFAWSNELGYVSFEGVSITCIPSYHDYSCIAFPSETCVNNCGKTISTISLCTAIDDNHCSDASILTPKDCSDHSASCPPNTQTTCPNCSNTGTWREVAP